MSFQSTPKGHLTCWVLTVILELDHKPVDDLNPPRTFGKPDTIASRREPFSDGLETTVVVVAYHVVENSCVVDERIQLSAHRRRTQLKLCYFFRPDTHRNYMYIPQRVRITWILFTLDGNYDTIRYDSVHLTCGRKLTGIQLSLPHGINKK